MRRRSRDGWAEPDPAGEERSLARAADAVERRLAEGIRPPRHHPRRVRGRGAVARGGATGRLVVNPDGLNRTELQSKTVDFKLRRGDVISMSTQGGGAYGPVEARDPEAIARDLREEKITPDAARDAYGYQGAKG